jgi:hypothetical protein
MSRRSVLTGFGISVVSAAAGAGVAWYIANKKITEEFEQRIDKEVKESVDFVLRQHGIRDVVVSDEDPETLAEQLNEVETPVDVVIAEEIPEEPTVSEVLAEIEAEDSPLDEFKGERVFGSQEEKPPLEDLAQRNQETPYHKIATPDVDDTPEVELPEEPIEDPDISIISRDIFMENGTDWEQETLTYFADGGVLNVQGDFVEDHELMIGQGRPRFGQLSEDENVVYIRNKRLEKEFEILSDPGNASEFLTHSLQDMYRPSWEQ